jgi:hypothetical protein
VFVSLANVKAGADAEPFGRLTEVVNVGLVPNTSAPVPVSPVTALAKLALDGVARNVATPEPSPEIPVDTGSPVAFVSTPEDGVPSAGVVNVGDVYVAPPATVPEIVGLAMVGLVPNTKAPDPVSSVTAEARFALDGVAKNAATPDPRPLIPVDTGSPVALVSVPVITPAPVTEKVVDPAPFWPSNTVSVSAADPR